MLSEGCVIVYVWRQRDAEVVAENIRGSGIKGGVVVYHGGMDTAQRTRNQSKVGCFGLYLRQRLTHNLVFTRKSQNMRSNGGFWPWDP